MNQDNYAAVEQQTAQSRKPTVELLLLGVLFAIIAAVSLGVTWQLHRIRANRPQAAVALPPPTLGDSLAEVPDFSLIDQDGRPVTLGDLKGHVWVANFFFTSCPLPCPTMNMKMQQIHRALPKDTRAKLVSITVDPAKDSPEVLAEYAKSFRGQDERWMFLTGDKQAIVHLAIDGFKLAAADDPNVHSLRLALVDRDGRIRGYFDSTDDQSVASLQQKLKALLNEN
jgi:cytochrome oxidase Cu insertion factor (SCO1/SenC/PrrC family)